MKKAIYSLILPLIVVSGLVLVCPDIKAQSPKKSKQKQSLPQK